MDPQIPLGLAGHTHILGRTRTGKSRLIAERVLAGIREGYGVCVVDPHGELYGLLRDYLAGYSLKFPQLNQRVILFDPLDSRCPGFDPLHLWPDELVADRAEFLTNVICDVFHSDQNITVLLARVLRNLFAALIESDRPLADAMDFLARIVDPNQREQILAKVENEHVRRFWLQSLPSRIEAAKELLKSTENRLAPLLTNPRYIPIFNRSRDGIDLLKIVERGLVLLVNAPKGLIGEHNSKLLGAFVTASLQQAVMRRRNKQRLFWTVLDEFQLYTSPSITSLFAEVGKYNNMLMVAHQHLSQIKDESLLDSVMTQCTDSIVFSIDENDAEVICKRMFKPSLDQVKHAKLRYQQLGGQIYAFPDITWRPMNEIWELEARKLSDDLNPRYFYQKRRNMPAFRFSSKNLPDPNVPEGVIESFIDRVSPRVIVRVVKLEAEEIPQKEPIVSSPNQKLPEYIPLWADWPSV